MFYCPGSLFGYCPIIRIGFCVILWKMTFFPNFFSYHIFAIYVGGASLGLPTACRLIAVSGAHLPSVDGLVVRCIKMHHHVKSAITICLHFAIYLKHVYDIYVYTNTQRLCSCVLPTKYSSAKLHVSMFQDDIASCHDVPMTPTGVFTALLDIPIVTPAGE